MPPRKAKPKPTNGGRKRKDDSVHVASLDRDWGTLRFTISENLIEKLVDMHDARYAAFLFTPRAQRMKRLRVQFVRMIDAGMSAVLLQIEPPTYDPRGKLLGRRKGARQFITNIAAKKIGVDNSIVNQVLEWEWSEVMQGLVLFFDDTDMLVGQKKPRKPGEPDDLVAR